MFEAAPKSVTQILCVPGMGFYVPAYQRGYTWGTEKLTRLVEDAMHGLCQLTTSPDAATFLGTVIVIHDTRYVTVAPQVTGDLPSRVLLVIDGQQRLTSLLLLVTALHEELTRRHVSYVQDTREAYLWLGNKAQELIAKLTLGFQIDMHYGAGRYYPRMVRAFADSWSRTLGKAEYRSPVASILSGYCAHVASGIAAPFRYVAPEELSQGDAKSHKFVASARHTLRSLLDRIARADEDLFEIPDLCRVQARRDVQEALFLAPLPVSVLNQITSGGEGTQREQASYEELFRLVIFAIFLLERVTVTEVIAKSEDYAFDMFEALNTTGEPLTALETFSPRVIEAETLKSYNGSPSQRSMAAVEEYLNRFEGAQEKHSATSTLLIPFALAESGDKLPKKLSDQRRYLREAFGRCSELEEKRAFLRHLEHHALFLQQLWPERKNVRPKLETFEFPDHQKTLMLLDVLRASKHDITIGLLARFYSQVRAANGHDVDSKLRELQEAIHAVAAFFGLWRGSRTTTDKIDGVYRRLLREGVKAAGVAAFARKALSASEAPSAERLRAALRSALLNEGGIANSEDWVVRAASVGVYDTSAQLAKFLLFAATHETVQDPSAPGLVRAAKPGTLNMLTLDMWRGGLTLEHVAPRSRPENGWRDDLYAAEEPQLIDRLGNLTLVPAVENASVGNRSWKAKRAMYSVFVAPTQDEVQVRLEAALDEGIDLRHSTIEILKAAPFLPHVEAIVKLQEEWSATIVKARSRRLAELAWNRLWSWLS